MLDSLFEPMRNDHQRVVIKHEVGYHLISITGSLIWYGYIQPSCSWSCSMKCSSSHATHAILADGRSKIASNLKHVHNMAGFDIRRRAQTPVSFGSRHPGTPSSAGAGCHWEAPAPQRCVFRSCSLPDNGHASVGRFPREDAVHS